MSLHTVVTTPFSNGTSQGLYNPSRAHLIRPSGSVWSDWTRSGIVKVVVTFEQTNIGLQGNDSQATSTALMELRRISGLTTEQIARIFGVSRRSIHLWASGKSMSETNEKKLRSVLSTIQQIDRGNSRSNRTALLNDQNNSRSMPVELLAKEKFTDVINILGRGQSQPRHNLLALSKNSITFRKPPRPENLINAIQSPVHRNIKKVRAARSVKIKSRS